MNQIPSPVLEGSTYTFKGRADLEDRQRSPYLLLPFDVPDGISELCVRYEYSDEVNAAQVNTPGNVLDIGLFSPEGAEFGTSKGFRGWSGSMRHSFYVGSREATPGYLPAWANYSRHMARGSGVVSSASAGLLLYGRCGDETRNIERAEGELHVALSNRVGLR